MGFCSQCGAKLQSDAARFCAECGAAVSAKPAAAAGAADAVSAPAPAAKPVAAAAAAPVKKFAIPSAKGAASSKVDAKGDDLQASQFVDAKPKNPSSFIPVTGYVAAPEVYDDGYGKAFAHAAVKQLPQQLDFSNAGLKADLQHLLHKETNWMLAGLEGDSNKLITVAKGTGGLQELKKTMEKLDHQPLWGLLKVNGFDGKNATGISRPKLVYVTWVGPGVPEMTRAQFNPLKSEALKFFGVVRLEMHLDSTTLNTLTSNTVGFKLNAASGSHKSESYQFGPGDVVNTDKLQFYEKDAAESDDEDFH